MKRFIVVCLVALLGSCQEDDQAQPVRISEVSVLKNGELWPSTEVFCGLRDDCTPQELGFSIVHSNEQGFEREAIGAGGFSTVSRGRYPIVPTINDTIIDICKVSPNARFHFSSDDGDVGAGGALLDTTANNWVEIIRYDTVRQELWGKFNLTFIDTLRRDTLRFTEGEFHTTVLPDTRGEPE